MNSVNSGRGLEHGSDGGGLDWGGQLIELEGEGQTMYSLGTGYYVLGLDTKG